MLKLRIGRLAGRVKPGKGNFTRANGAENLSLRTRQEWIPIACDCWLLATGCCFLLLS